MTSVWSKPGIACIAALVLSGSNAHAGTPVKLSGSIAGIVRDTTGIPQMGATVLLFNRYERLVQRALTNERGAFGFEFLSPDSYSVRVSLASFVPAMKRQISVQPGMQSLLYINMASLLSSVELVYAAPGQGALMSDDWRWTLKSSIATRPALRLLPGISVSDPNRPVHTAGAIFSDTRGLLRVSAGGAGSFGDLTMQPDLGTAFALATSLFGHNQLQFSGNLGHTGGTGIPATSIRTSFSRDGLGPEVAVTIRQVYLPVRGAATVAGQQAALSGQQDGYPPLRTMSLAMIDRVELTDSMLFEYGMSVDSISFIDHLNYFSPFARLSYDLGRWGTVRGAYSSGSPPAELFAREGEAEAALHQDLIAMTLVPRVSLKEGRAAVQRTQSFEIGYEKKLASRTYHLNGYRETLSNGALTMAGPNSLFPEGDFLPGFASHSGTFDIGSRVMYGYSGTVVQPLAEKLELSASVGRSGAFVASSAPLEIGSGDEMRSRLRTSDRYWAAARVTGTVPVTGTQISTSYQWTDYNSLIPAHLYLTQKAVPEAGWNVHIRQPIPSFPGMPGRLEATADLRNMLAQGYLALPAADGRHILLMQSPRAFRGGLSFIF